MKYRHPYLDYLQRKLKDIRTKDHGAREDFLLNRAQSVKWMLRGLLFIPITAVTDHFYRAHKAAGSEQTTLFMVFVLISIIGMMQFPVGLYLWLKNRNQDIEKGPEDKS